MKPWTFIYGIFLKAKFVNILSAESNIWKKNLKRYSFNPQKLLRASCEAFVPGIDKIIKKRGGHID